MAVAAIVRRFGQPGPSTLRELHFDFNSDAGGEIEVGKGVDGFVGGVVDDDEAVVGEELEVVAGVFVNVGTGESGDEFAAGGERDGADDFGAGSQGGVHDFLNRFVNDAVVKGFEF